MTAITTAARLLRVAADELKNAHTLGGDWGNELEALDAYNEHMATATTLEHMARQCLAQIEEPAQPICWIRFCSDGSTEGPIMHSQICEARKTSGAWTPLYAGAAPAAVAPEHPPMPETWAVVASIEGQDVVCISSNALSGKGELTESEEQAVIGMAQHLLAFVGYGLPPCDFDADDEPAPAPALEAPAAPLDDSELEDLAHSANQECLSFGMSLDPFLRLAKTVRDRMLAAAPQTPAQEAPAAPAVPAGFALVPIEPTQQMLNAGRWSGAGSVSIQEEWARKEMWSRMLATITPPPAAYTDDLVALVENLAQALSAAAPDNDLAGHALNYLKRNGLQESPLRASEAAPRAPAAPADMSGSFVEWFSKNYPGDTIIVNPAWHARSIFHMAQAHARLAAGEAPAAPAVDASDTALLDALAAEFMDLRCFDMPTGQGDADVGWRVIQHHMGEPTERVVSEVYKDDPRSAIRAAIARLERDPYCTGALHEEDAGLAAQAKEGGV